ncbi:DUF6082 family protein [Catenuloplanes indicus]|uniref:Uncharacterized protein n=1 Tax=Catenuloplanes indicus TaxID=137267 RepID=A0AAE3VXM2_9ACTN|nr:DUF6082 family protein [Catenuloplanes indicus]MDQ0366103.1 hypothetical protein [Catenuloplanes indicus]
MVRRRPKPGGLTGGGEREEASKVLGTIRTGGILALLSPVLVVLVGFSPVLLLLVAWVFSAQEWERLSLVGQTYGAVAALLTALTLFGIILSLRVQARSVAVQVEQHARATYAELVTLGINNPELISAGPFVSGMTPRMLYTGLWLGLFRGHFMLGYMTADEVRRECLGLFEEPDARLRWQIGREYYVSSATERRGREFIAIVDAACAASGPRESGVVPTPARMVDGDAA